jgi:hypothetical protein
MCCKLDDVNFFHLLYYEINAIVCFYSFSMVIFPMLSFMFILLFFSISDVFLSRSTYNEHAR